MLSRIHPYYYLGGFFGGVLGYIISKIYQIWAIVYRESQFDVNMTSSWPSGSPPLWITATEHPMRFSFWMVLIYIIIGVVSTIILLNRSNANKVNE
ncbi:hypothetical protein FHS18_004971 [Paenibacillus phyllosphaerae]|uniref:Uncharacterized protein n=1 Tax=Paenibacillus phyllosphaerae TaxID=274593 RepID=A0A7W5B2B2_9BACL|nr:hypothetical protein [Paenibacillus phyllosphaerae]